MQFHFQETKPKYEDFIVNTKKYIKRIRLQNDLAKKKKSSNEIISSIYGPLKPLGKTIDFQKEKSTIEYTHLCTLSTLRRLYEFLKIHNQNEKGQPLLLSLYKKFYDTFISGYNNDSVCNSFIGHYQDKGKRSTETYDLIFNFENKLECDTIIDELIQHFQNNRVDIITTITETDSASDSDNCTISETDSDTISNADTTSDTDTISDGISDVISDTDTISDVISDTDTTSSTPVATYASVAAIYANNSAKILEKINEVTRNHNDSTINLNENSQKQEKTTDDDDCSNYSGDIEDDRNERDWQKKKKKYSDNYTQLFNVGCGPGGVKDYYWNYNQLSFINKENYYVTYFLPTQFGFNNFCSVLSSAKKTIDICVYRFSDYALLKILKNAKKRGVTIRIITDERPEDDGALCEAQALQKYQFPYRTLNFPRTVSMHNKFAVIDSKILINGSNNWSLSGRSSNIENINFTNIKHVTESFSNQFEKLWKDSKDRNKKDTKVSTMFEHLNNGGPPFAYS